jgi:signal transduction histidine kinase
MRLFAKYNRINIVASILALLLGSISYYFIVRYVLVHELDDTLKIEEAEILNFVKTRDRLPEPANYRDQRIAYTPSDAPVKRRFQHSSWLENRHAGETEPVRELIFSVRAAGQYYTVSVGKSEEESENLLEWIMLVTAGMILLLLGMLYIANRLLLRRIWQPFYQLLDGMRRFNLSARASLPAVDTRVDEFRDLADAGRQMTGKIVGDYEMLKSFADNASHEMQTPVAIIHSKLDLLIQDPALEERHHRPITAMYDAVRRLRQLNQSLLLLSKIENNQFTHTDRIELGPLILEKLVQLEDMVRDRRLEVKTDLDKICLHINGYLADILLNNILVNAIRHNEEGGHVDITLQGHGLRVRNSGPALHFDADTIFDRFTKGPQSTGTGLGLAIVRQICDNYQFPLRYSFEDDMHMIDIRFPDHSLAS